MPGKPGRSAQGATPTPYGQTPRSTASVLGDLHTDLSPDEENRDSRNNQPQDQNDSGEDEANTALSDILPSTLPSDSSEPQQRWGNSGFFTAPFRGSPGAHLINPTTPTLQPLEQSNPTLTQRDNDTITALTEIIRGTAVATPIYSVQIATTEPGAFPEIATDPNTDQQTENLSDDPHTRIHAQYLTKALQRMATALGKELPAPYSSNTIQELPEISTTTFLSEMVAIDISPTKINGIALDYSRIWQRRKQPLNLPWEQALRKYKSCSEKEIENWLDADVFYLLLIDVFLRASSIEVRQEFKTNATTAIGKWRSPMNSLPKIYPKEKDWKEGDGLECFKDRKPLITTVWETLNFNLVQGLNESGRLTIKYFIIEHREKNCRNRLHKLQKEIGDPPFFPLPKFGVSQRLLSQGMTELEAKQAAALFQTEMEACLLEIWSFTNPTLSAELFRRQRHSIWNHTMAFWKEDMLRTIEATEDCPETYFQRDLPPHTTPRTGRRAPFAVPEGTMGHHKEGPEERWGYTPSNYPTHNNRQDTRNLHSIITSRQVGTLPMVPETPLYVGCGRLNQSIRGPQRFHNTSNIITPSFGIAKAAQTFEPPETIPDNNPIWIDSLPGSQDGQQEEDRDPDERQGPPGGNPDDPDDDGSTGRGPPGGPPAGGPPGRGPPGGGPPGGGPFGNPNPWVPRFPRGPPVPGGGGPPGGGPPGGPQPPQNF